MRTKRVFSLTSLFLAGVAVCGCQTSNPTPPVRPSPWQNSQVRTTPTQGMTAQNGSVSPNGMVMQPGIGGAPQYTSPTGINGMPGGGGYNSVTQPASGFGGQSNMGVPGSPTNTNYGPSPSTFPSAGVQQSGYAPPVGGDMGGMSMTRTQCPPGGCPTGDATGSIPPPPTNTLPSYR